MRRFLESRWVVKISGVSIYSSDAVCTRLVFPNLAGNLMSNTNLLQRGFYPALRRAGLRKIRFHDLRHTYAPLLIASGEDIVRVSRLLGHSSPTVTLNVYAHMLPTEHYQAAERLADLVFSERVNHNRSILP